MTTASTGPSGPPLGTGPGSGRAAVGPANAGARRPGAARARLASRRALTADLLTALCCASAAFAVALWLAYGGPAASGSLSGAVTAAGIVSGLVGTDLVLVMLVLAARIPIVDRTFGRDVVMGLHRKLGKPALSLLLAHGVLLILGYGLADGLDPVAETLSLLSLGDIVLSVLAMGLLITVVVTSLVAVRRRFPYEVWHAIHLLSYGAVLFAVPHQLSVGGMLAEGTWQRLYWIGITALAVGSVGWYRFLVPTIATLRHRLQVQDVETIAPGVISLHLSGRNLSRLGIVGGQYATWRFWSRGTWWHAHPISFSSVGDDRSVRITVRALGTGSGQLAELPRGTRVSFEGPYGIFTGENRTAPYLAVVAAGIGVTPVRSMLEDARLAPGEATVLLRARSTDEQYLWGEVRTLVERAGGRIFGMTGSRGSGSWLTAADQARGVRLETVFPHLLSSDLYVCGPQPWTDLVVRDALAAGLREDRIHVERFDW
jgi:predicted ferric reductase